MKLCWPVEGGPETRPVGPIIAGANLGTSEAHAAREDDWAIDIPADTGVACLAVCDAKVITRVEHFRTSPCGMQVDLAWEADGVIWRARYCHLSAIAVKLEQNVRKGQVIGLVGSTGRSAEPHLHWVLWKGIKRVRPEDYLTEEDRPSVLEPAHNNR